LLKGLISVSTPVRSTSPLRFADAKVVASYVELISSEYSSGARQRPGALTKQGNAMLRFLWCEAAIHAERRDLAPGRFYRRQLQQKGLGKARVGRKLGIRLWILLRDQIEYDELCRRAASWPTS
jgi:transposase